MDEKNAVLVESDGQARVIGSGKGAYFIEVQKETSECRAGTPLTFHKYAVHHAPSEDRFDLKSWSGSGGTSYTLVVDQGKVSSTQAGGSIY